MLAMVLGFRHGLGLEVEQANIHKGQRYLDNNAAKIMQLRARVNPDLPPGGEPTVWQYPVDLASAGAREVGLGFRSGFLLQRCLCDKTPRNPCARTHSISGTLWCTKPALSANSALCRQWCPS